MPQAEQSVQMIRVGPTCADAGSVVRVKDMT